MVEVTVIDYGMGNLRSVAQAVKHVAAQTGHVVGHFDGAFAMADYRSVVAWWQYV